MKTLNLAVVTAGLSDPSSTRLLADRLADATRQGLDTFGHALDVSIIELRDLASDIAHNMTIGFPGPTLKDALDTVSRAEGLIAVTPILSASYSGLFKSFFDVLDRTALRDKPVLIAATGGTARHSLALEHALRPLFAFLQSQVVPTAVFAATDDWAAAGDAYTDGLPSRIDRAAGELARLMANRGPLVKTEQELVPFAEQLAALGHSGQTQEHAAS